MILFFYMFAGLLITGSLGVILSRNPVYSVLWLIFAFANGAGLFVLLGAEFLAMTLIIVYVGAVAVLFLFVVMMLDINVAELKSRVASNWQVTLFFIILFASDLMLVINLGLQYSDIQKTSPKILENVNNTFEIGKVLYTEYMLPFQIAGLALLISMIGCIALTLRHGRNIKRQNQAWQVSRNKKNSLEIANPEFGKGLKGIKYD